MWTIATFFDDYLSVGQSSKFCHCPLARSIIMSKTVLYNITSFCAYHEKFSETAMFWMILHFTRLAQIFSVFEDVCTGPYSMANIAHTPRRTGGPKMVRTLSWDNFITPSPQGKQSHIYEHEKIISIPMLVHHALSVDWFHHYTKAWLTNKRDQKGSDQVTWVIWLFFSNDIVFSPVLGTKMFQGI